VLKGKIEKLFYLTGNMTINIMKFIMAGLIILIVISLLDIAPNDPFVYGQFLDTASGENATNDTLSIPGTPTNDTLSIPGTPTNHTVM
jgi:hypothetical protein